MAAAAAPSTWGWLTGALSWTSGSARSLALAAAMLPHECKQAMSHSLLVCTGTSPEYFTPGFGPWQLGFGLFALGAIVALAMKWVLIHALMMFWPHIPWLQILRETPAPRGLALQPG